MSDPAADRAQESRGAGPQLPRQQVGGRTIWWRIRRRPVTMAALILLGLLLLSVTFGPLVLRIDPTTTNPLAATAPPGNGHLLGTDELGRDVLARMLYGGRITLAVGVISMVIAIGVGTLVGGLAGFYRGAVETVLMRLVDAMMAIPPFFLILAELAVFGREPLVVVIVVGLNFWMHIARVVYAEFLRWRTSEFVEAAMAMGASPVRIMVRHILPQVFPSIIVLTTLGIGWAILTETGLSYLGLGIQPPLASWGNMLQNSQVYMWTQPMLAVYPGLAIMITVLTFNTLGNGLRDVLDPKMKT